MILFFLVCGIFPVIGALMLICFLLQIVALIGTLITAAAMRLVDSALALWLSLAEFVSSFRHQKE
jgi:hypothetical protein